VNSGASATKGAADATWEVSHFVLTGPDALKGVTGVSVPIAYDFFINGVIPFASATKPSSAPGAITCDISAPLGPGITLTGTVTGIVHDNGSTAGG
jgi:hypothetical protein